MSETKKMQRYLVFSVDTDTGKDVESWRYQRLSYAKRKADEVSRVGLFEGEVIDLTRNLLVYRVFKGQDMLLTVVEKGKARE